ncbi:MAG: DotA/TraY family protein [Alphaproteobacteria bacterium]
MTKFMLKDFFRYTAMPEIMPRLRALLFSGFGYVPFFIAVVYQMVGLLPRHHPYLMQKNVGRFGLRHVMAEAANHITFSVRHIDQIILYVAVLVGVILFAIQFLALGSVFVMQPAFADLPDDWGWTNFFVVADTYRPHDLAYMMLDMVFGVPFPGETGVGVIGFFESCVSTDVRCLNSLPPEDINELEDFLEGALGGANNVGAMYPLATNAHASFPFPFHEGLHQIFRFYSTGLLVIAVMMGLYFVVTVVGETSQTGTPFGKRFNKTWAPIRIVIAFGLLMPLNSGLNSGQYLVLYAAKYGTAFASNGWRHFVGTLEDDLMANPQSLVSTPNSPYLNDCLQFMFVARACKYAADYYFEMEHRRNPNSGGEADVVQAYILLHETLGPTSDHLILDQDQTYGNTVANSPENMTRVKIRFGARNESKYPEAHSNVMPVCGDLILPWTDGREVSEQEDYIKEIQEAYFDLVKEAWLGDLWLGFGGGDDFPAYGPDQNHRYRYIVDLNIEGLPDPPDGASNHEVDLNPVYVQNVNAEAQKRIQDAVAEAVEAAQEGGLWGDGTNPNDEIMADFSRQGWASAGIYWNRIAEINGKLTGAVFGTPQIISYPAVMETVSDKKAMYTDLLSVTERYEPEAPAIGDLGLLLDKSSGQPFATALSKAYEGWYKAAGVQAVHPRGNPVLIYISHLLGLDGLFNMRENAANSTHPLAQLSGVGKSLVESSIRSLGYALGSTIFAAVGPVAPKLLSVVSNFFITIAMLGLTVGFVLFYVLPFLPFIYFFFAVGGWIKGIFEAMVGVPLWALAHIRIDGHGMPGNAAMNGYFLLFEIFLRPILIVFGMLASITIFSALSSTLNTIFSLVSENVAGYDMTSQIQAGTFTAQYMRSLIDQFFFTIIYTIIIYMIGMSAFKLVDLIPNNILRWMGQSVASFGDQREDPAQGLISRAKMGSQQVLGKLGGGLSSMASAAAK